jgi:hypothetical protein
VSILNHRLADELSPDLGVSRTAASSPLVQAATMQAPSVFASVMGVGLWCSRGRGSWIVDAMFSSQHVRLLKCLCSAGVANRNRAWRKRF